MGLATSGFAAAALFGDEWQNDPRYRVLHCGIDFSRFTRSTQPEQLRAKLGIPRDRRIIGHLSRLDPQKNHTLSIRLLQEMLESGIDAHLLIIGGGAMEGQIRVQIESANLTQRVTMVGDQADVVPFLALTECLLFPSIDEGLGIVVLEGQAMGVPTVASDCVPPDVDVIPGMVEFLPLDAPPPRWIAAIQSKLNQPRLNPTEAVARLQASDFSVEQSLQKLCAIYRGEPYSSPLSGNTTDRGFLTLSAAEARQL